MAEFTDEQLIGQYRSCAPGPRADLLVNELFERYHSRLALWCLRISGDREAAADLAQDVLLKAFRNLDSFRGDAKFSTWLYTVTRNHCFSAVKGRTAALEPLTDVADAAPDPHEMVERADSAAAMRELVNRTLTETENRVMTLHYGEELPLEAITRLLRLENASGAKAYIVSAKRKLARYIGGGSKRI